MPKDEFDRLVANGEQRLAEQADQQEQKRALEQEHNQAVESSRVRRARRLLTLPSLRSLTIATDLLIAFLIGMVIAAVIAAVAAEIAIQATLVAIACGGASALALVWIARARARHFHLVASSPFSVIDYELALDSRNLFDTDEAHFEITFRDAAPSGSDLRAAMNTVSAHLQLSIKEGKTMRVAVLHPGVHSRLRSIQTNMDLNGQRRWLRRWFPRLHQRVLMPLHARFPLEQVRFVEWQQDL